jgi:hypothetical protein
MPQFQQCFKNVVSKSWLNLEVSSFINTKYWYEKTDWLGNIILQVYYAKHKTWKVAKFSFVYLKLLNKNNYVRTTERHSLNS